MLKTANVNHSTGLIPTRRSWGQEDIGDPQPIEAQRNRFSLTEDRRRQSEFSEVKPSHLSTCK